MRALRNPVLTISNTFHSIASNRSFALIDNFLRLFHKNFKLLSSYRKSNISKNSQRHKSTRSSLQQKFQPRLIKTLSAEKYNTIKPINVQNECDLSGQSVLCIGGRKNLYMEYERLTQKTGAQFMSFHGAPDDVSIERLLQLLEKTDMIVCPIDCINHQVFIIVKCYCQFSEKPCVILDRSTLTAFRQGIHALASWVSGFTGLPQKAMVNLPNN